MKLIDEKWSFKLLAIFIFNILAIVIAAFVLYSRNNEHGKAQTRAVQNGQESNTPINKGVFSCARKTPCLNCNLLLISVDSLRADHVGVLGYKRDTTPNVDNLAKEGVLFTNYFTTAFLTPISEMSLHTGMYPSSSKMDSFTNVMPESHLTLAQILKNDGYKTFAGHSSPEFMAFNAVNESFNRGYDVYDVINPNKQTVNVSIRQIPPIGMFGNLLDKNSTTNNKFFGWITIGQVHWPYGQTVPNIFADPNYNGVFKNQLLAWNIFQSIYQGVLYPDKTTITNADARYVVDMYDNGVRSFDNFVGEVAAELDKRHLRDHTIIVIVSEHGEDLGEHGYFGHYDVMDTQVHTPLIIIYPNTQPKTILSEVSSVDVLPTILEMLGINKPPQIQGRSTVPLICGDEKDNRDVVYIERVPLWEQSVIAGQVSLRGGIASGVGDKDIAIRTPRWKYIKRYSKDVMEKISWWGLISGQKISIPGQELYDIVNDPLELHNVAGKNPRITANFNAEVSAWLQSIENITSKVKEYPKIQDYF